MNVAGTPSGRATALTASKSREQTDRVPLLIKLFTEIASLLAIATALLFYFGWVRSSAQAHAFGTDVSLFGMSTQDFVLRSTDVIFLPALAVLLLSVLAVWIHRGLTGKSRELRPEVATRSRRRANRLGRILWFAWLLPFMVGVPLLVARPSFGAFALPFLFAAAIGGTWYGCSLRRYASDSSPSIPLPFFYLASALLVVSMFWMTERVARVGGEARADGIKDNIALRLNSVTIYSATRLQLSSEEINEIPLKGPKAAYLFRYDGLYFLQKSGGYYFLLTDGWDANNGRLIVLPESMPIRVEFGPGR
jgi:hypothetical protein